ncbi:MAG: hypothetical protein JW794_09280, partial [Candidatus Cloacimonetes bacterium]|nr:hypothetical protein [Candidatus Cloacimonadota bacterium]
YSGRVGKDRGLMEIAQSIQGLENVRFEIANSGNVSFEDEFMLKLFEYPNVFSLGNLTHERCIQEMVRSDLLLAFYNPDLIAHKHPNSNKVFEAMMLKIPIFTNFGTSLSDFVVKHKIGIVTEYSRTEIIKDTIRDIKRNKSKLETYGDNAQRLYIEAYNWKKYANVLRKIYIKHAIY